MKMNLDKLSFLQSKATYLNYFIIGYVLSLTPGMFCGSSELLTIVLLYTVPEEYKMSRLKDLMSDLG